MTLSYVDMTTYDYSVDGFSFIVDKAANTLTTGTTYLFRYYAINA